MASKKAAAMFPSSNRSRFFVKVVAEHTGSQAQTDEPAEQQVVVQLLINCCSLWIVYSVWSRRARNNFSGRTEGRPKCTHIML